MCPACVRTCMTTRMDIESFRLIKVLYVQARRNRGGAGGARGGCAPPPPNNFANNAKMITTKSTVCQTGNLFNTGAPPTAVCFLRAWRIHSYVHPKQASSASLFVLVIDSGPRFRTQVLPFDNKVLPPDGGSIFPFVNRYPTLHPEPPVWETPPHLNSPDGGSIFLFVNIYQPLIHSTIQPCMNQSCLGDFRNFHFLSCLCRINHFC